MTKAAKNYYVALSVNLVLQDLSISLLFLGLWLALNVKRAIVEMAAACRNKGQFCPQAAFFAGVRNAGLRVESER